MYDGGEDEETAREEAAGWHQKTRTPHRDVGNKQEPNQTQEDRTNQELTTVDSIKPQKQTNRVGQCKHQTLFRFLLTTHGVTSKKET